MFKKLRTVIYKVSDLQAAKQWYIKIAGKHPYFDQPFYVGFDIDGCELGLDPDMKDTAPGNQSVAYWAVDSVADVLKELTENGATIFEPRTNVGGNIHVAIVKDPFGNYVGIIEGA
ncbi:MAG: VOC family protein [Chitinophagaceae bacterium]